jgi:spermidine synthase
MWRTAGEDSDVTEPFTLRLAGSGLIASLQPDAWRPGSWVLSIDDTPQSHIDLADPTALHFDYIARMGHIIDAAFPAGEAITALHLGAGGLTLPRYVDATRSGSRQQVVEIERDLIDFVREHCPLPRGASIRCRYGDARHVMESLPKGLLGQVDLVIVDVFHGARTPAHVTSVEFYTAVKSLLTPTGVVVANVTDGPPMAFARGQLATIRFVFGDAFAVAEQGVANGKRFGNVVIAATSSGGIPPWVSALAGKGPHPTALIAGPDAAAWSASATIVTDNTATPSPPPARNLFRS